MGWIGLVDDDPELLDALGAVLRGMGYEVRPFTHGGDAIEAVETGTEPADLLVLDLMMPFMSGEETLRRLSASPRGRLVPVVVLSGRDVTPGQLTSTRVQEVLVKPVTAEELRAAIARAMAAGRT